MSAIETPRERLVNDLATFGIKVESVGFIDNKVLAIFTYGATVRRVAVVDYIGDDAAALNALYFRITAKVFVTG